MRRAKIRIDYLRVPTLLQFPLVEPFVRELQDGLVRAEILNQLDDTNAV